MSCIITIPPESIVLRPPHFANPEILFLHPQAPEPIIKALKRKAALHP